MNATLVEIQRIQTRLQQLGRAQSPSPSTVGSQSVGSQSVGSQSVGSQSVGSQSDAEHPSYSSSPSIQLPNESSHSSYRSTSRFYSSPHRTVIRSSPQVEHGGHSDFSASGQTMDGAAPYPEEFQRYVEEEFSRSDALPHSPSGQLAGRNTQYVDDSWVAYQPDVSHGSSSRTRLTSETLYQTHPTAPTDANVQYPALEVNEGYGREAIAPDSSSSSSPLRDPRNGRVPQTNVPDAPYVHHRHPTQHDEYVLSQLFQQLNLQAQHVNTMASALSHALDEMRAIAEQVDHQRAIEAAAGRSVFLPDLSHCLSAHSDEFVVPYVTQLSNGALVIEAASIRSGYRPAREGVREGGASGVKTTLYPPASRPTSGTASGTASRTASGKASGRTSSPSKKSAQHHSSSTMWPSIHRLLRWLVGLDAAAESASAPSAPSAPDSSSIQATHSGGARTAPLPPTKIHDQRTDNQSASFPPLGQSLAWIGGSVVIRLCLDTLLATHPALWPLAIAIVVTPAAIAIYRTVVDSRVSFTLGRRLILIMFGLLLGGRLS
ncbi:MAG: hypothetical protein VKL39_10970 [Leptolyngbyaceae bacterium]|nr:hypothetical protein [Leptolyngbyaceae bacterium]